MKKEKLITRTITTTTATVMCLDVLSAEVKVENFTLTGRYENNPDFIADLREKYDTDSLKLVSVQAVRTETHLRGMTEHDFYLYSEIVEKKKAESADTEE